MHDGAIGLLMTGLMLMGVLVFVLMAGLAFILYAGRQGRADPHAVVGVGRSVSEAEGMPEMRFALGEIDAGERSQGRIALRQ